MREVIFCILAYFTNKAIGGVPQQVCQVNCDEEKLIAFLASLEVLSPESIFNLAITDLQSMCSQLKENFKTIEPSFDDCKTKNPRGLYISLIKGIKAFNNTICGPEEKSFVKKFHYVRPCLFELRQDFESCNGPADWNEEPDDIKICKTYKTIVDCYYTKSAKVCGKQAAKVVTMLIEDVVENVLGHSCKGINSFPIITDMMPDTYLDRNFSKEIVSSPPLLLAIGLIKTIIMNILFIP